MHADLCWMLYSQPIGFMCKDIDNDEYAYSILTWHERLIYPDEFNEAAREAARARRGEQMGRLVGGVKSLLRLA